MNLKCLRLTHEIHQPEISFTSDLNYVLVRKDRNTMDIEARFVESRVCFVNSINKLLEKPQINFKFVT